MSIIGVVAALTVPSLIFKNQEQETVVRLKKNYSTFAQAFRLAEIEYGSATEWGWESTNSEDQAIEATNKLLPYLNLIKFCAKEKGCTSEFMDNLKGAKGLFSDGSAFSIQTRSKCIGVYGIGEQLKTVCALLSIDVNGPKGPNTSGRDYFEFYITKYGVIPRGIPDDTSEYGSLENGCNILKNGCAAWVIYKENLDYLKRKVSWNE